MYHEESPDGVVEEDDGGGHEHGEADEFVELQERWLAQWRGMGLTVRTIVD
jgi:hypothetical protein